MWQELFSVNDKSVTTIAGVRATASQKKIGGIQNSPNSTGKRDSPARVQTKDLPRARVLVAEHNAFVREGIVSVIDGQADLCCCGETDSVAAVPAAVTKHKPDLVLTDLRFKDGDAFQLISSLSLGRSGPAILVLSQYDEVLYAERALQAGARGYVMKVEAADELLNAIRTVLKGKVYLSPAMSARLVQRVLKPGLKAEGHEMRTKI